MRMGPVVEGLVCHVKKTGIVLDILEVTSKLPGKGVC